jgi:hypothetical protein
MSDFSIIDKNVILKDLPPMICGAGGYISISSLATPAQPH